MFLSRGDNGDVARTGEDERGEEMAGRLSQDAKIGAGAKDSILSLGALSGV